MKWRFRRRLPAERVPSVPRPDLAAGSPAERADYDAVRAGFTAAVSHELRTPLARLLALLDWAALPGADASELIRRAREEVLEIGELIDDLLFLSELETGRQIVSLGTTLVGPVAEQTIERYREEALRAAVRLQVEIEPELEVPLRPRMLRVLLDNLVENAIRHSGARSSVLLQAKQDGDRVLLAAADDGVGVAEGDLPRIFERFFRGDDARAAPGTGLGLAIVKHVVTAAGGRVDASGGPGRGLRVVCVFPARA